MTRWTLGGAPVARTWSSGVRRGYEWGKPRYVGASLCRRSDVKIRTLLVTAAIACAVVSALLPVSAGAQSDSSLVIEVQDAVLDGSREGGSSLVRLRVPGGAGVASFDVVLSYDPAIAAPLDVNPGVDGVQVIVGRFWANDAASDVDLDTGMIHVSGSAGAACAGDSCLLFIVSWRAETVGESPISVAEYTLGGPGVDADAIAVEDGVVSVADAALNIGQVEGGSPAVDAAPAGGSRSWAVPAALVLVVVGVAAILFAKPLGRRLRRAPEPGVTLSASEEASINALFDRLEAEAIDIGRDAS